MTHQFHDALDRLEAKERAQSFEALEHQKDFARLDALQADYAIEHAGDQTHRLMMADLAAMRLVHEPCTCGPNPDAPACPSCSARADLEDMPF